MHIKIWSDIRCPFCYIGKKRFEAALNSFPYKDNITIEWKSFELDPNLQTTNTDALTHFIENKGIDRDRALSMFNNVTAMADGAGLDFNLEASIPANSFKAHRLIHYSKQYGRSNDMKEALLKAHISEGKNIDNIDILLNIAGNLGMNTSEVKATLESDAYAYDVRQDELEARNLGINSVPFFAINNKYGISGAQPSEVFLEVLSNAWEEFENKNSMNVAANTCDVEGNCN
ncbi:DsbA family oxidoreductase [Gaetbulibacter saemankumensis]|uniref:DsbA family oxidoreductase n=1 Tax=Gaetbulibacter saemankumensis TaxID=311208 RepID=UPI000405C9FD|nr:DsbA family oxidoreductase [Gaetbulibacter saemankumensis]